MGSDGIELDLLVLWTRSICDILEIMAYDILIKGGLMLDGVGNPAMVADVGISDGKIAEVGGLGNAQAAVEISATGKYVAPGFIDITNHSDTHLTLFKYPLQESMVMQGVTTIIGGNCGSSLAPLVSREAIRSVSKWADLSEIGVNWTSVDEFLAAVERTRLGVNFGMLVGYGTLRRGIVGNELRPLSLEEKEKIRLLLERAMEEGAFGLSMGLSYGHERASTTEELIEIARPLAQSRGVLKIHLRSEGAEVLGAVNEAIRIGRETGASVIVSHFKVIGRKSWPLARKALEFISNARSSGVAIWFDVSPYRTTGSPLYLLLPPWSRRGGFEELFRRLSSQVEWKQISQALASYTLHYDKIMVIAAKQRQIVGNTLAEIAAAMNMPPEEAVLEIIRGNEGRVTILGRTVSLKNTSRAIGDSNSLIASDGYGVSQDGISTGNLVHPRSFGAFPHFWHRFVTDTQKLKPEEAIVKITGGPATILGITGRGVIAKGNVADIAVFDPQLIRDRATYKDPYRYPAGIQYVIINGEVVVSQGRHIGVRAGKILRKS